MCTNLPDIQPAIYVTHDEQKITQTLQVCISSVTADSNLGYDCAYFYLGVLHGFMKTRFFSANKESASL